MNRLLNSPLFWMEHDDYYYGNKLRKSKTKPYCEVNKVDGGFEIEAHLPGFKREQIKIEVENNVLSVDAHRNNSGFEISHHRNWTIDDTIDVEQITAKYEEGLLTIKLVKQEQVEPKVKQIIIN